MVRKNKIEIEEHVGQVEEEECRKDVEERDISK